jgi:hypothetical protein
MLGLGQAEVPTHRKLKLNRLPCHPLGVDGNIRHIAIRAKSLKRLAERKAALSSPRALKV